jgi:hypothetical protein
MVLIKIEAQCTKKRSNRSLALRVFFYYLAFEKRGGRKASPPPISKRDNAAGPVPKHTVVRVPK